MCMTQLITKIENIGFLFAKFTCQLTAESLDYFLNISGGQVVQCTIEQQFCLSTSHLIHKLFIRWPVASYSKRRNANIFGLVKEIKNKYRLFLT